MKAKIFLTLSALLACAHAEAQVTNAPAAPRPHVIDVPQPDQPVPNTGNAEPNSLPGSAETNPAKIADFQRRFAEGKTLQQAGKFAEALQVYEGILADEPHARGSLFEAGKISFSLNQLTKADEYLSRLHQLEPDFPAAIELLIQVNQALKRDVKVELLLRDFRALHDSGKVPQLSTSLCFVRERFSSGGQQIVVSQFFDYTQSPNTVWMAEVFDTGGTLQHRLLLNYDPDATRALRAKDAKYQTTEVFTWFEHVLDHGRVTAINAYLQIFALPDYAKFRSAMLVILANPPKPIYSAPVTPP